MHEQLFMQQSYVFIAFNCQIIEGITDGVYGKRYVLFDLQVSGSTSASLF